MQMAADERQMARISRQMRGKSARQMGAVFSPYNPLGKCRRRLRGGIICRKRPRISSSSGGRIGRQLDDVERGSARQSSRLPRGIPFFGAAANPAPEITVKSAPQPSRPPSVARKRGAAKDCTRYSPHA
jgi:hypothetical protein